MTDDQHRISDDVVTFDCESAAVADSLGAIAEAAYALGGRFAPGLVIQERAGHLSGHRDSPHQQSLELLVSLPQEALPRVNHGIWRFVGDDLVVDVKPDAAESERLLLGLMADLFTATGKPKWYATEHPRAALAPQSGAIAAIQRLRPQFTLDPSPIGFLATRAYQPKGYSDGVLMPIVDALNHHPAGAPLRFRDDTLRIGELHPTGTSECLLNYGGGRRDPLGMALNYGFADSESSIARSGPLDFDVAAVGPVTIGLSSASATSSLDPPQARWQGDVLHLSHLTFQAKAVHLTAVPIQMLLESLGVTRPELATVELLWTAADLNIESLRHLRQVLDPQTAVGAMLQQAIDYQTNVLVEFQRRLR